MYDESDIRAQYRRRVPSDLYSVQRDDVFWNMQRTDAALRAIMQRGRINDFGHVRLLEVGCGAGDNLLRFIRWGFQPANLVGNELLEERLTSARVRLPPDLRLVPGDASKVDLGGPYDIVHQSTVLSSILDSNLQGELARRMWELLAPGGSILSYDFAFNNPRNPDVHRVTINRLQELFPAGRMAWSRVTLAPPLARQASRSRLAHDALNSVPWLRTHRIALITKTS